MQDNLVKQDAMMPRLTREVGRVVISLPRDATLYIDQRFIAAVWDEIDGEVSPKILGTRNSRLPFMAQYEVINHLGGDRARRCVDGSLCVDKNSITPERYLEMWRLAIQRAVTADELFGLFDYSVQILIRGAFDGLRGKPSGWSSSPFKSFDDFEQQYRDIMTLTDDGSGLCVEFDLLQPNAARDAFYLRSFLCGTEQTDYLQIRLKENEAASIPRLPAQTIQAQLFDTLAADA